MERKKQRGADEIEMGGDGWDAEKGKREEEPVEKR